MVAGEGCFFAVVFGAGAADLVVLLAAVVFFAEPAFCAAAVTLADGADFCGVLVAMNSSELMLVVYEGATF